MKYRNSIRFIVEGIEGVAVTLAVLVTWPVSTRWLRNWGSIPEERRRGWPADELVLAEHTTSTRAVTVHASGWDVWTCLVQFGLGRARFNSCELLERLVGIPVKNVESIVPEYQNLAVGDEVVLHPRAPGIPVAALKRGSHICFGVVDNPERPFEKPDPARSWSLHIQPRSERVSRLLLRSCVEPLRDRSFSRDLAALIEASIDFVMEQRMLRTIKRLAESGGRPGRQSVGYLQTPQWSRRPPLRFFWQVMPAMASVIQACSAAAAGGRGPAMPFGAGNERRTR